VPQTSRLRLHVHAAIATGAFAVQNLLL
jgi:hypothetical protein